ncbi:MAG: (Fe-S)-binding protein [Verrucomicrobiales bacterium]|nr:(Fe-S)-binding protein [Verrucomicrobiales bacterium]
MTIGLFVPCYIDQLYPRVARASWELLTGLGHTVESPEGQTCCGQPLANSGHAAQGEPCVTGFSQLFGQYDAVVGPSGSCVLHLKEHLEQRGDPLAHRIHELCEFLHDIARVERLEATFPHRVGLHQSCHGLRGLGLGRPSECQIPAFSKPARLLGMVGGLELVPLDRADECCGFGGTFSVQESDVSVAMGTDRLADHERHRAEFITSADMSCLMHLGGLASRAGSPVKVIHIAEILAGNAP